MDTIWLFEGEELDRLREALEGARRLRVAVDAGELKFKVNERTWSPGFESCGNDEPAHN